MSLRGGNQNQYFRDPSDDPPVSAAARRRRASNLTDDALGAVHLMHRRGDCFGDVSSTDAQTLISPRVENASNPHDCVRVFPNSELRTPNSELALREAPLASFLFWNQHDF